VECLKRSPPPEGGSAGAGAGSTIARVMLPSDALLFRRGPFSNFAASPISLPCPHTGGSRTYATVEHYFQACKARSLDEHNRVAMAEAPKLAKHEGRRVVLREDWEEVKFLVMRTALRAKFDSEPFRAKLLDTGERFLAEDSPHDFEWGIRDKHGGFTGQNLLGWALMLVRDDLRTASGASDGQLSLSLQ
jgi:N-glycosidase YbiA